MCSAFWMAMDKRPIFPFETESLGLFKCISLLIKYYMFNEKGSVKGGQLFEGLAALIIGSVRSREEVKMSVVVAPPLSR